MLVTTNEMPDSHVVRSGSRELVPVNWPPGPGQREQEMTSPLGIPTPQTEITPPARRSTISHGAAQAALGCRRDSRVVRVVIAAMVALFIVAIAPRGHADTS